MVVVVVVAVDVALELGAVVADGFGIATTGPRRGGGSAVAAGGEADCELADALGSGVSEDLGLEALALGSRGDVPEAVTVVGCRSRTSPKIDNPTTNPSTIAPTRPTASRLLRDVGAWGLARLSQPEPPFRYATA